MSTLGNLIWLVFGGFLVFLEYMVAGLLLCLTIIGIPFGLQAFKLAQLALWHYHWVQEICSGLPFNTHEPDLATHWRHLDCIDTPDFWSTAGNYHHWHSLGQTTFQTRVTGIDTIWKNAYGQLNKL